MDMMKVCEKVPSEVRLEKNWVTSVNERAIQWRIQGGGGGAGPPPTPQS